MVIFLLFVIVVAAFYVMYKRVVRLDEDLKKIGENRFEYKEPDEQTPEEKEQVRSYAIKIYGEETKNPLPVMCETQESVEKHYRRLIRFIFEIVVIVVITILLMKVIV